jgi:hypothetical protein
MIGNAFLFYCKNKIRTTEDVIDVKPIKIKKASVETRAFFSVFFYVNYKESIYSSIKE